jgi:hypothetical protein
MREIKADIKINNYVINEHLSGPVEEGTIEEGVELLVTWI